MQWYLIINKDTNLHHVEVWTNYSRDAVFLHLYLTSTFMSLEFINIELIIESKERPGNLLHGHSRAVSSETWPSVCGDTHIHDNWSNSTCWYISLIKIMECARRTWNTAKRIFSFKSCFHAQDWIAIGGRGAVRCVHYDIRTSADFWTSQIRKHGTFRYKVSTHFAGCVFPSTSREEVWHLRPWSRVISKVKSDVRNWRRWAKQQLFTCEGWTFPGDEVVFLGGGESVSVHICSPRWWHVWANFWGRVLFSSTNIHRMTLGWSHV